MGITCRKIPEIAGLDVLDIGTAFGIEHGDTAASIGHDRPFCGAVPVHLANAARSQSHVDPGHGIRNREIGFCHLTCPASVLDTLGGIVERTPEELHVADIRRGRALEGGELVVDSRVLRAGIAEPCGIGVDCSLRRLIGIAERCRTGGAGGKRGAADGADCEDCASGQSFHFRTPCSWRVATRYRYRRVVMRAGARQCDQSARH